MQTNIATLIDIFSAQDTRTTAEPRRRAARRAKRNGDFYDDNSPNRGIHEPKGWNADYPNIERLVANMR